MSFTVIKNASILLGKRICYHFNRLIALALFCIPMNIQTNLCLYSTPVAEDEMHVPVT